MRDRMIVIYIFLLADVYAFQGLRTLLKDLPVVWSRLITVLYWLIPILLIFMVWMIRTDNRDLLSKTAWAYFFPFIMIAYVSKLVMAGALLIGDIGVWISRISVFLANKQTFLPFLQNPDYDTASGLTNPGRSKFLARFALILGAIPFTTLIHGIIRNAYRYRVLRETVTLDNLPAQLDGLKIIQISDIHSGSFTLKEPIRKAIRLINQENADLVFFTGDIVNSKAEEMDNYMDVFDKIESKHGVYSVLGNHDYGDYGDWKDHQEKEDNFERMKQVHKELGWNLLLNENRILDINGKKLSVIGVENWAANHRFRTAGDLQKAYEGADAPVKLLLSHDPSHWDAEITKEFKDIDITFSGHTHGFQFGIEIPGFIKWSPSKYLYKQWAGLYQKDNQYIYVNRGLGFLGYPGRVGMLPEITVMELKSGKIQNI